MGDSQQQSDKHRRSGFVLIVLGVVGALFFLPLGLLILAGIGELVYALTLRDPRPATTSPPPPPSLTERLAELDMLRSQGRITEDEYVRLRAQLLGGPPEPPR